MNAPINRQEVERQLRLQMAGAFDLQPYDVQKSLVDTRMRALQAQQPANAEQALVVRERVRPQPQHLTPPPLPKADADEAELRTALREAQRANAEAQRKAEEAKAVLARAEQHRNNCETQLIAYTELDEQATELRIKQFREDAYLDIPHHLSTAFRERGEVIDNIQIASKALDRLKAEDKQLEREATLAFERLCYAARDVAFGYVWKLYRELRDAEQGVLMLRTILASAKLVIPGLPTMHPPAEILSAVNKLEVPAVSEDSEFTGVWSDFAMRLRDDADATPDVELLVNGDDA
jgi:hypothetical protein